MLEHTHVKAMCKERKSHLKIMTKNEFNVDVANI